jgi:hypothetical protein
VGTGNGTDRCSMNFWGSPVYPGSGGSSMRRRILEDPRGHWRWDIYAGCQVLAAAGAPIDTTENGHIAMASSDVPRTSLRPGRFWWSSRAPASYSSRRGVWPATWPAAGILFTDDVSCNMWAREEGLEDVSHGSVTVFLFDFNFFFFPPTKLIFPVMCCGIGWELLTETWSLKSSTCKMTKRVS